MMERVHLTSQEISDAFNMASDRPTWSARPNSRDGRDMVVFDGPSDIIEIRYDTIEGVFRVRFIKAEAALGKYMYAIAHAASYIAHRLMRAGLPFYSPPNPAQVVLQVQQGNDDDVIIWWRGLHTLGRDPDAPQWERDGL